MAPDMKNIDSAFQFVLGDYATTKVVEAFGKWLKTQSYAPTPADIVAIIENKPIFDTATYIAIKDRMKEGEFMLEREKQYLRDYERQKLNEGLGETL